MEKFLPRKAHVQAQIDNNGGSVGQITFPQLLAKMEIASFLLGRSQ